MNDFNLLELNHIADGLARLTAHYSFSVGLHEDILRLYGKVESMIDKYDDNFECGILSIHFAVKIRQTPFVAETINMSNSERIANIICFLTLIFGGRKRKLTEYAFRNAS